MKRYRIAFFIALLFNLVLGAALFRVWQSRRAMTTPTPAAANAPVVEGTAETGTAMPDSADAAENAALQPIQLSAQRMQSIGVKTAVIDLQNANDEIRATGNVDVDETRLAVVQLRFPGWIRQVFVDSTFQYVRKGQPLFTIYSPALVTTQKEYLLAKQYQAGLRQTSLPGVASGAASLVSAAAERLRQWEVPEREIAQLESTGKVRDSIQIDSPVSGYVTERNALPNVYAEPSMKLYTIADLSTVWVYAQVFQSDLNQIRTGAPATVTVDSYPGAVYHGRVDQILPQVDAATRTAKVRLVFPNPGLKLKPGMFVNVNFAVPLGQRLMIPASGIFFSGTRSIAFVDRGNGYLEPHDVELGPRAGDSFVVLKGLEAGARVVTSANFLIDSESQLQAAIGSFAPPPPGAGAAAAMNVPAAAAATIHLSTDPSPPHKGANVFRVMLTGVHGAPLTGAAVTVTFFMPAMPAMGMAAIRVSSDLQEKNAGVYEGTGVLQTGGTWQVTIVVRRNGQTVATKQTSLDVEGGM